MGVHEKVQNLPSALCPPPGHPHPLLAQTLSGLQTYHLGLIPQGPLLAHPAPYPTHVDTYGNVYCHYHVS